MPSCFFVSDLHGNTDRYQKLFDRIKEETPDAVFIGGDILPSGLYAFTRDMMVPEDFITGFLKVHLNELKNELQDKYPGIFLIMGNDDGRVFEPLVQKLEDDGLLFYMHNKKRQFLGFDIYGYAYVPPTPFRLKDWERYDLSRYVDPGCVPPEEGAFTVEVNKKQLPYLNIRKDLAALLPETTLDKTIILFHTPPYQTSLDRAGLDGKFYEHVPLDVHVGSIAVKELIEERHPMLTLHGHIHESTTITGKWMEIMGKTVAMNAAHDGPELSLIRFDTEAMDQGTRELI
jgi:Icc-related predicted phosphoesterase